MLLCTIMVETLMLLVLLLASFAKGAFFQPIAYTLPDGLLSVNGSSNTGGCQESCIMMLISGTTINFCDCPGSTAPASGVLIDEDIPSINITQRGTVTWASELFVVNKISNGPDSFTIGFQFRDTFFLRYVEVTHLNCQIWGAGLSAVNVYSSQFFPNFVNHSGVFTNIGTLSLAEDTDRNCSSLRTISIPLQPTSSINNYFIEFILVGSSVHPLNWLHLAEIRFSTVVPATTIPTTLKTSESATLSEISTLEPTTTITSTNEDDDMIPTITQSINAMGTDGSSEMYRTFPASITAPTTITVVPVSVFVGTLVGVAAVLVLLTVIIFMLCVYLKRAQGKVKQDKANGDTEYDDVIERGTELSGTRNPVEMKVNEAYGIHREDYTTVETPLEEAQYAEIH